MIYQSLYNPKTFQTPFQSCVWAMESMVLHKFPGVEFVVDDRRFLICCVNRLQAWRSLGIMKMNWSYVYWFQD